MRAYVLFVAFLKNGSQANNWLQDHIMKAHLEWTDKPESGIKRKVRITFLKGQSVKWQFKRSDEDRWNYNIDPTIEDWEMLKKKTEALYKRRRLKYDYFELVTIKLAEKYND